MPSQMPFTIESAPSTTPRRQRGFTLVELMVSVSILGILLAAGVPAFYKQLASWQRISSEKALISSIARTRSEAIRSGKTATMCARASDTACSTGTSWSNGWLIMVGTTVLHVHGPLRGLQSASGTAASMDFGPNGLMTGANTITLTPSDTSVGVYDLEVSSVGRVRLSKK